MKKAIMAIDLGGTRIRRSFVGGKEILSQMSGKRLENMSQLKKFVKEQITFGENELGIKASGIAIAVAGEIENHDFVINSPNAHFLDRVRLKSAMHEFGLPCVAVNDMEGAVRGMAVLLPKLSYFMGITWSSGIGLRIYDSGKLIAQKQGGSEGGHIPLDLSPFAPLCGCGRRGCAEAIIGGKAIERRVQSETAALGINLPAGLNPNIFLDEGFDRGGIWAKDLYENIVAEGMGAFLATYQSIFRLPTIVWKGTFAKNALPRIEKQIFEKMIRHLMNPGWAKEVKFVFSPDSENDGLIGAARILEEAE